MTGSNSIPTAARWDPSTSSFAGDADTKKFWLQLEWAL